MLGILHDKYIEKEQRDSPAGTRVSLYWSRRLSQFRSYQWQRRGEAASGAFRAYECSCMHVCMNALACMCV